MACLTASPVDSSVAPARFGVPFRIGLLGDSVALAFGVGRLVCGISPALGQWTDPMMHWQLISPRRGRNIDRREKCRTARSFVSGQQPGMAAYLVTIAKSPSLKGGALRFSRWPPTTMSTTRTHALASWQAEPPIALKDDGSTQCTLRTMVEHGGASCGKPCV